MNLNKIKTIIKKIQIFKNLIKKRMNKEKEKGEKKIIKCELLLILILSNHLNFKDKFMLNINHYQN